MQTLPTRMLHLLNPFALPFSERVWPHAQVFCWRARSSPPKTHGGRCLAGHGPRTPPTIPPLPSGAQPSCMVESRSEPRPTWVASSGVPLILGIDETLERRRGKKIVARGIYRDAVRCGHEHFFKAGGLRWVCAMLLVPVPWAGRVWALPFLSVLAPSERYAQERGKRHKKITDWARQMLLLLRRWYPEREIVVVADRTYASLELLDRCRGLTSPITFVTRLRPDAALYEPAPPRRPGQMGRPRLKGERLPNLSALVEDPATDWSPITVSDWYGEGERVVEIATATAVWYSTGLYAVPLRWVLIRDPQGAFATQALLCTGLHANPERILSWFVMRGRWKRPSKRRAGISGSRRKGSGRGR